MSAPVEVVELNDRERIEFHPDHMMVEKKTYPYASLTAYGLLLVLQTAGGFASSLKIEGCLQTDGMKRPQPFVIITGTSIGLPGQEQSEAVEALYGRLTGLFDEHVRPVVVERALRTIATGGQVPVTSIVKVSRDGVITEGLFKSKLHPWATVGGLAYDNGDVQVRSVDDKMITGSMKLSEANVPILEELIATVGGRGRV